MMDYNYNYKLINTKLNISTGPYLLDAKRLCAPPLLVSQLVSQSQLERRGDFASPQSWIGLLSLELHETGQESGIDVLAVGSNWCLDMQRTAPLEILKLPRWTA